MSTIQLENLLKIENILNQYSGKRYHFRAGDDWLFSIIEVKKIGKGKLYMRFIPRFMANEPLHIECYAYDTKEPFAVAVDYKQYWCANFVVVKLETLKENIKEIMRIKGLIPS